MLSITGLHNIAQVTCNEMNQWLIQSQPRGIGAGHSVGCFFKKNQLQQTSGGRPWLSCGNSSRCLVVPLYWLVVYSWLARSIMISMLPAPQPKFIRYFCFGNSFLTPIWLAFTFAHVQKDEVARHKSVTDRIWVTYKDGVYDITDFIAQHPGGAAKIMLAAGGAIDPYWNMYKFA